MKVIVGEEYVYIGEFVRVREIYDTGEGDGECEIETRFGEITTCHSSELTEKEKK